VEIRLARPADAEAIRQIYNAEVTGSTVTFDLVPRSLAEQEAWLEARSGAMAVLVAELGGEVVGFASLSPYKDRPAYATSVEDSVYVRSWSLSWDVRIMAQTPRVVFGRSGAY
jgi:phosphinothricin acetyltransferase